MKAFLYRVCAIFFSHFVLYPDYRISFFIPLAFRFADYMSFCFIDRTAVFLHYILLMKLNSNFKLRHIAGETIIINQGTPDVDFTRIISLNSSARFLWNKFCGKEFSVDEVGCFLAKTYHIPVQQARQDAMAWVSSLKKCNVIID